MSFVVDASAALALHFEEEAEAFLDMEQKLQSGVEAATAPNFFSEVMEGLRKAIRAGRTTPEDAAAWLTTLDSYSIVPIAINPCAGSATWLIAEQLNISAYDAGYIAIAKSRGVFLYTRDKIILNRAPKVGVVVLPS